MDLVLYLGWSPTGDIHRFGWIQMAQILGSMAIAGPAKRWFLRLPRWESWKRNSSAIGLCEGNVCGQCPQEARYVGWVVQKSWYYDIHEIFYMMFNIQYHDMRVICIICIYIYIYKYVDLFGNRVLYTDILRSIITFPLKPVKWGYGDNQTFLQTDPYRMTLSGSAIP